MRVEPWKRAWTLGSAAQSHQQQALAGGRLLVGDDPAAARFFCLDLAAGSGQRPRLSTLHTCVVLSSRCGAHSRDSARRPVPSRCPTSPGASHVALQRTRSRRSSTRCGRPARPRTRTALPRSQEWPRMLSWTMPTSTSPHRWPSRSSSGRRSSRARAVFACSTWPPGRAWSPMPPLRADTPRSSRWTSRRR